MGSADKSTPQSADKAAEHVRGEQGTFGVATYDHPHQGAFTSNQIVSDDSTVYGVDTGGSTVTITLASALVSEGAWVIVNDVGGNAGTNAITIDTEGSETIDGGSSATIGSNYGAFKLYSDGVNWFTAASVSGGGTL